MAVQYIARGALWSKNRYRDLSSLPRWERICVEWLCVPRMEMRMVDAMHYVWINCWFWRGAVIVDDEVA